MVSVVRCVIRKWFMADLVSHADLEIEPRAVQLVAAREWSLTGVLPGRAVQGNTASDDQEWASLAAANAPAPEVTYEDFTAWSSPMPWGG